MPLSLFLSDRKFPVQKGTYMMGEVVHHVNGKLEKHCLHLGQKSVSSHHRFLKKRVPITFSSKCTTH
jgi:hypothetical protein